MRDATWILSAGGRRWCAPLIGASVMLAACQAMGAGAQPAIAPDPNMGMGCEQAEAFAFSGQTTLAAIGLEEFAGGPDAQRTGMIWVTADPVSMFGPGGAPPGMANDMQRMVCVQWPDGSGMAGAVPPGWEPPSTLNLDAQSDEGPPFVLIGLVLAAALIGGVSFVAFRGDTG